MKKVLVVLMTALALTGCASTQYTEYTAAQVKIAEANAQAQKYKYESMVLLAKDGSDVAKVAALITINQQQNQPTQQLAQPKSWQDSALQWA